MIYVLICKQNGSAEIFRERLYRGISSARKGKAVWSRYREVRIASLHDVSEHLAEDGSLEGLWEACDED